MPLKFWDDVFVLVVHLINQMPTAVLDTQVSNLLLISQGTKLHGSQSIGYRVFPYLRPYKRHKLDF